MSDKSQSNELFFGTRIKTVTKKLITYTLITVNMVMEKREVAQSSAPQLFVLQHFGIPLYSATSVWVHDEVGYCFVMYNAI